MWLSEAAKNTVPLAIECKRYATFSVYKHYEQARSYVEGNELPLLVIQANRSEPLVCLSLENFMKVLRGDYKNN